MTAFTEKLDRAAGAATCAALTIGGGALISAGAVGIGAGGAGLVPLAVGSLAMMAAAYGCGWDPDGPGPEPEGPPQQLCYKGGSNFTIRLLTDGVFKGGSTPELSEITGVAYDSTEDCQTGGSRRFYTISWKDTAGNPGSTGLQYGGPCGGSSYTWTQVWEGDSTCLDPGPPPTSPIPPYDYTDPEDGCKLTVNLKGFTDDGTGAVNPVFKIEPSAEQLRADGGVIGGCNFSPVIYTGGPPGGGPPPQFRPWNPDWDEPTPDGTPPWLDLVNDLIGGLIGNAIYDALNSLVPETLPPANYKLIAPCDEFEPGVPLQIEVAIPELPTYPALATRIDALIPLLQGQKDFKQPICPPVKPEGEFRTIGFISQDYSPNGRNYLRKRLRYRSVSGLGLDAVIDHWKDFRFDAGPVIVKHRGATWGTVAVWAASSNEGKRVIRHAAGEAGIDADQVGRWEVSGSSSTRLGMPGKMKVNESGGYYWITARDDSNGRPLVGVT